MVSVFVVEGGKLHQLTAEHFKNTSLSFKLISPPKKYPLEYSTLMLAIS